MRPYTAEDFLAFLGRCKPPPGEPDRHLKPIVKIEQENAAVKKAEFDAWLASHPHTSYCQCVTCSPREKARIEGTLQDVCPGCGQHSLVSVVCPTCGPQEKRICPHCGE